MLAYFFLQKIQTYYFQGAVFAFLGMKEKLKKLVINIMSLKIFGLRDAFQN